MSEAPIDYKRKYQVLKKKLKFLVYEQECFAEELKKSQRKLLKLTREKSYLLDQLMQYEHPACETSDSEDTQSSNSEQEITKKIIKKKKASSGLAQRPSLSATSKSTIKSKKKINIPNNNTSSSSFSDRPHHMTTTKTSSSNPKNSNFSMTANQQQLKQQDTSLITREEIERHLEMKHFNSKNRFLNINVSSHKPPDDIFNNDNSNQECTEAAMMLTFQNEDDSNLVIDMAQ